MNIFLVSFLGFVVVQRLLELRVAARNRQWALARGATEYAPEHYPLIVVLHIAWIAGFALEGFARGANLSVLWEIWLSIFVIAQIGRYWAIASLGFYWNTRILIVPGAELVRRGPYKFFSHPNYLVVALELFSGPMVFGASITAIIFSLLNAVLLLGVRIPAEERALQAYSATLSQ
jgi:methyltransferase